MTGMKPGSNSQTTEEGFKMRLLMMIAAIMLMAAAPPKEDFVVTFMIHVHDKDTVVEIESKAGKVQKFRGDQEEKIKEALNEGDHYIDILDYRDQKLRKVIFKQKVKEGRDA